MTERTFTQAYVEHATLRDGTRVVVRLVRPEDKGALAAGFARLSFASRHARFLAPKSRLSRDELRYLTEIDQEAHFALGALRDDSDDSDDGAGAADPVGLGIARFIRIAGLHATAEAAIAVADDAQGHGLGKLLLTRLCAAAAERGIERFHCDVLGSNTSMAALLEDIAPERTIAIGDGVMTIELALPHVTPTAPPTSPVPSRGMYALLRAAAQNVVELTTSIRHLWRGETD